MQLEIVILSEVRQRQIHGTAYMCNLKYDTNEPIYESETESWMWTTDWLLPRGRGLRKGWSLELADVSFYING